MSMLNGAKQLSATAEDAHVTTGRFTGKSTAADGDRDVWPYDSVFENQSGRFYGVHRPRVAEVDSPKPNSVTTRGA